MYVILSERVGVVGAFYDVETAKAEGVDIEALVAGGFIGKPSTTKPDKTSKVKNKNPQED